MHNFRSSARKFIKSGVWYILDRYLYKWLPHGFNLFIDIKKKIPGFHMGTIFDVGANVGQSARMYAQHYPSAHVICFEPVRSTYTELRKNLAGMKNIEFYQLAMGSVGKPVRITLQSSSLENSLLNKADPDAAEDANIETVDVGTLDDFCANHDISHIDFLKLDTEGFDLLVLMGGHTLLDSQRISLIQVEAGISPGNKKHVPIMQLKEYLETKGFLLFGVYDQITSWSGEPRLRFCNAVFLSSRIIDAYNNR